MKPSQSVFHTIRGLRYHVRTWGNPGAPKLFMLHGWMDVSASFQFLVDALKHDWHVIAPDWRGFGETDWAPGNYWFPDYYADLDALLDIYEPHAPINLIGHSLGGNIASNYSGIRPQRVTRLASLEGFGWHRMTPDMAPRHFGRWLDELKSPPAFRAYRSFDEVEQRMIKSNPRLQPARARFLARHWAKETGPGEVVLRSDPRHKMINPVLNRVEESVACWRKITAPVLWVHGKDSDAAAWKKDTPEQIAERRAAFGRLTEHFLDDAGHMMHHDQPEKLAAIIEDFLAQPSSPA
jgi:pimeloyl-ACP methyl ester carboxylesterase